MKNNPKFFLLALLVIIAGTFFASASYTSLFGPFYDELLAKFLARLDAVQQIPNIITSPTTTTSTPTAPVTNSTSPGTTLNQQDSLNVQRNSDLLERVTTPTPSSNETPIADRINQINSVTNNQSGSSSTTIAPSASTTSGSNTVIPITNRDPQVAPLGLINEDRISTPIINRDPQVTTPREVITDNRESTSPHVLGRAHRQCMSASIIKQIQNRSPDEPSNIIFTYKPGSNIQRIDGILSDYLNEKGLPFRNFTLVSGKAIRQMRSSQLLEALNKLIAAKLMADEKSATAATSGQSDDAVSSAAPFDNGCALFIEPDIILRTRLDTSVAYIKGTTVHQNYGITGKGVKIAILDTGVNIYHECVKGRVVDSKDFTGQGIIDENGHGTHVACIAAGNSPYFKGNAPEALILNVKTTDRAGNANMSDVIAGIEWGYEAGSRIQNISLGALVDNCNGTDALTRTVDAANDQGVLIVASAGNFGPDLKTVATPGCAKKDLTVGAVDEKGYIAEFSSRGPTSDGRAEPLIFAPGVQIASAWYDGNDSYVMIDGTSQAAPHVAGIAALLLEANPKLTPDEIKNILITNVDPLSQNYPDVTNNAGIINAVKVIALYATEKKASAPENNPPPQDEEAPEQPEISPEDEKPVEESPPPKEDPGEQVGVQKSSELIEDNATVDQNYTIEDKATTISSLDEAVKNLDNCMLQAGSNNDVRANCSRIFIDSQIKFKKTALPSKDDQKLNDNISETAEKLGKVSSLLKESVKNKLREISIDLKKTLFVGEAGQIIASKTTEIITKIEEGTISQKDITDFQSEIDAQHSKNAEEKYKLKLIPFFDVEENKWFHVFIDKVKNLNIASGYKDANGNPRGDFGPANKTTVAEALKMALESSKNGPSSRQANPKNSNAINHWAKAYFLKGEELGLKLLGNTSDDPNRPITRQEFVQLQLQVFNIPPLTNFKLIFSDIDKNSTFAGYIYQAYQDGIIAGDSDKSTFRPFDHIVRAEISKVIIKSIEKYGAS